MSHFSLWSFKHKEGGKCPITYLSDSRGIFAFAEQNAWQFYLIVTLPKSIYTETAWRDLLWLVWKLHQHSQELEKKPLITQTCHNHLKDVSLKAIFPKWHRQTWAVGSKASALLCEHSLLLFGKSWDHCATHSVFPRLLFLVVENTQKASCVGRIHIRFPSQSSA